LKILVIFTGGTIGSKVTDGKISPHRQTKYTLIENYLQGSKDDLTFDFSEPYFVLSENLSAEHLNSLTDTVKENLNKGYDGIIITHGTDSLQFSAAAVSYAVGNCKLPILFVSANYPLEDERSNGNDNFKAAVDFIKQKISSGVFIAYKNPREEVKFHSSLDAVTFGEADDRLESIGRKHFANYEKEKIKILKNPKPSESAIDFYLSPKSDILVITAIPGDSFSYSLNGIKAIIIRAYHSGTLNTDSKYFRDFCALAQKSDIPIFVVSSTNQTPYETVDFYEELGITALCDIPFSAAYIRLWIGVSLNENLKKLF